MCVLQLNVWYMHRTKVFDARLIEKCYRAIWSESIHHCKWIFQQRLSTWTWFALFSLTFHEEISISFKEMQRTGYSGSGVEIETQRCVWYPCSHCAVYDYLKAELFFSPLETTITSNTCILRIFNASAKLEENESCPTQLCITTWRTVFMTLFCNCYYYYFFLWT